MGRLDEKWAQAGTVVGDVEQHIEGKLDALIARKTEITNKTDEVFAKQTAPLDDAAKALDALDSKLNLLSNGGPSGPLPGSGDLLTGQSQQPTIVNNPLTPTGTATQQDVLHE